MHAGSHRPQSPKRVERETDLLRCSMQGNFGMRIYASLSQDNWKPCHFRTKYTIRNSHLRTWRNAAF